MRAGSLMSNSSQEVRFKDGLFQYEQFPSWAGQSFEWSVLGDASQLFKEENASDSTMGGAYYAEITPSYAGDDFEVYAEQTLPTFTLYGVMVSALIARQERVGDTGFLLGLVVIGAM